jgi:hypothetical protein
MQKTKLIYVLALRGYYITVTSKEDAMLNKILIFLTLVLLVNLTGCASVPMAPTADDQLRKQFPAPTEGKVGLYIFRDSVFGAALTKIIYVDDQIIGATAPNTYFYREITPGQHKLSTQSEFSNNDLTINTNPGINYYVRHYIKMGVFVGGANFEQVSEENGKKAVLDCNLEK